VRLRRRSRLGLRARSSIAFGLVGLGLSTMLAAFTYNRTRVYLINQRESVAVARASLNAQLVSRSLLADPRDPQRILSSIRSADSQSMLWRDGRWFVVSANISPGDIPEPVLGAAFRGQASRQRFVLRDRPQIAVAVPLVRSSANTTVLVETVSLVELERTLRTIGATLAAGAAVATLFGAIAGLFASSRVLRPLVGVADTAERIGRGELDARLSGVEDRDLARLVSTFNQMTDSLQQRIDRERRFSAHVSHELRSPLTSLRGAMELVRSRRADLPDRVQLGVDILDEEVVRFERMVLDLLEITTIEAGGVSVELSERALGPLVEVTLRHLHSEVPVEMDDAVRTTTVAVDTRRFERILDNLITNARVHAGGAVAVRGEAVAELPRASRARFVRIHIDDAGPGVPESERTKVFERFARGARGRHLAGSGLGLALVREHVRLLRGSIDVTQSPEGGARFTITLPVAPS
jgi:two-component system, OmpR family, sensor histidine kinase MtrB